MRNVILTPNPYRDKNFQTVRAAMQILKDAGIQTRLCLPFEVDRSFELPKDLRFSRLDRELPGADLIGRKQPAAEGSAGEKQYWEDESA